MKYLTVIKDKFKVLWKYYILQSLLATTALFILVLVLGREKIVVISAMGATSFIVFALPTTASAQTRNVIGGHLVGLIAGGIFYFTALPYWLAYPLAVGVAIFVMVALDMEHPPAAGTALAVVINEITPMVFAAVVISSIVLSQLHYYLKRYLKDLI